MTNFTLKLTLLFTFSWITKSHFEFHSVVVQPGEEVTLQCSNLSRYPEHIFWMKLTDGPNISRISSMLNFDSKALLYDEFQLNKFNMTSNGTNIFLNIKQVDLSDYGVYICGINSNNCLRIFSEIYLPVQDGLDGFNKLPTVILGSIVIFLVLVIIGLVWKIWTFHSAQTKRQNQKHNENLDSVVLNYAAVNLRPKAKTNREAAAESEIDSNVLYAAMR